MSLIIRPATPDDLPAILRITHHAILHTTALWTITPATLETRTAWFHDRASRGFPIFVADTRTDIAGFASYGEYRPFEGFAQTVENSVYVDPDHHGQGIGRALLAALIDHATESGKHVMIAGIEASNEASIALHRRAGFTETAKLREVGRKFERWLDLLFMQRMLGKHDA